MDVLSDVLRAVRMTGAFFFSATNYSPWVCGEPTVDDIAHRVIPEADFVIPFHVITYGGCWVDLVGEVPTTIRLEAGDIIVLPKGDAHFMMSENGLRKTISPAEFDPPPGRRNVLRYIVNGEKGGAVDCRFVCGFMGGASRPFNPLINALPRMFRARTSDANREWLSTLAQAGVAESERDGAGAETMLAKLSELMFVEVVRRYIDEMPPDSRGWLAGLRDRSIGAALGLIHGRPREDWTVETLAQQVALSRSAFAERFTSFVGIPVIQYLARWRLTVAARLLEDKNVSIEQAGTEVGYESEAAFNRAFKKFVGTTPGAWRKGRRLVAEAAE